MNLSGPRFVFKVAARSAWDKARRSGAFKGSDDDLRDGFVHLSAWHQLAGTLARHFKGQADLVLVQFDTDALGHDLKWERSRGGDLFPHLYAALPTALARATYALNLDADGVPIVPEDLRQC